MTLREVAGADDYLMGVLRVVARIGHAADFAELVELLHEAVARLGASAAYFATFVRDDAAFGPRRVLLASDAPSTFDCEPVLRPEADPWLVYAGWHSTPARECDLVERGNRSRALSIAPHRSGYPSAVCVPTPAGSRSGRVGALIVGSRTPGFFDDDGYPSFKIAARLVAIELNDRCVELMRDELLWEVGLTEEELRLLRYARDGLTTKAIARESGWSDLAIDTRFKRILPKFHVHSRTAAARLAADYRII